MKNIIIFVIYFSIIITTLQIIDIVNPIQWWIHEWKSHLSIDFWELGPFYLVTPILLIGLAIGFFSSLIILFYLFFKYLLKLFKNYNK